MEENRDLLSGIILTCLVVLIILLIIKRKQLGAHIGYFILAMTVTLITELTGKLMLYLGFTTNYFVFNIGNSLFVFLLFFLYYYKILSTPFLKRLQLVIIMLFLVNYFVSIFIMGDFKRQFLMQSFFVEIVLLLISVSLFLYEIFNSERILILKKYYPFWISIGLIVIYFGLLPIILISTSGNKQLTVELFLSVLFIVNLIGYSILISGIFYSESEKSEN